MSLTKLGTTGITFVGEESIHDPISGIENFYIYEGEHRALRVWASNTTQYGVKTHIFPHEGSLYRARVSYSDPGNFTGSADSWEFNHANREVDKFANPAVLAAVEALGLSVPAGKTQRQVNAEYIANQREKVEANEAFDSGVPSIFHELREQWALGNRAYLVSDLTMRFRRVIPATLSSQGRRFTEKQIVYSSASLVSEFNVPQIIQNQMPDTSALSAPTGFAWGWVLMRQESNIVPSQVKKEEVLEWQLAAWSTTDYVHV